MEKKMIHSKFQIKNEVKSIDFFGAQIVVVVGTYM
jgi:hypothetical protein